MSGGGNKHQFEKIDRSAVPHTRRGKHRSIIEQILEELGGMRGKSALKIPRTVLGSAKLEHVRAALTRASARQRLNLATSSDDEYFYVWRQD